MHAGRNVRVPTPDVNTLAQEELLREEHHTSEVDPYTWERPLDAVNRFSRMLDRVPPSSLKVDNRRASRLTQLDPFGYSVADESSSYDAALAYSAPRPRPTTSSTTLNGYMTSSASTSPTNSSESLWKQPPSVSYGDLSRRSPRLGSGPSKLSIEVPLVGLPADLEGIVPKDKDFLNSKLYQRTLKAQKAVEKERARRSLAGPSPLSRSESNNRLTRVASDVGSRPKSGRMSLGWLRSASEVALPLSSSTTADPPTLPKSSSVGNISNAKQPTSRPVSMRPPLSASAPSGKRAPLPAKATSRSSVPPPPPKSPLPVGSGAVTPSSSSSPAPFATATTPVSPSFPPSASTRSGATTPVTRSGATTPVTQSFSPSMPPSPKPSIRNRKSFTSKKELPRSSDGSGSATTNSPLAARRKSHSNLSSTATLAKQDLRSQDSTSPTNGAFPIKQSRSRTSSNGSRAAAAAAAPIAVTTPDPTPMNEINEPRHVREISAPSSEMQVEGYGPAVPSPYDLPPAFPAPHPRPIRTSSYSYNTPQQQNSYVIPYGGAVHVAEYHTTAQYPPSQPIRPLYPDAKGEWLVPPPANHPSLPPGAAPPARVRKSSLIAYTGSAPEMRGQGPVGQPRPVQVPLPSRTPSGTPSTSSAPSGGYFSQAASASPSQTRPTPTPTTQTPRSPARRNTLSKSAKEREKGLFARAKKTLTASSEAEQWHPSQGLYLPPAEPAPSSLRPTPAPAQQQFTSTAAAVPAAPSAKAAKKSTSTGSFFGFGRSRKNVTDSKKLVKDNSMKSLPRPLATQNGRANGATATV